MKANIQFWIDHFQSAEEKLQNTFFNISEEDCRDLLKEYDFDFKDFTSFESAENRVFGFDDKIIKFYRPHRWSLEALNEEILFLKDLLEAKLSFVHPIGGVEVWKGLFYVIFEKVKKPYKEDRVVLDEDSVSNMVNLIAQFHEVGSRREALSRYQFDSEAISLGCFEVIKSAGFLPQSLYKRYEEIIINLNKRIQGFGYIPVQRIHGDAQIGNIVWRENKPIFLDLDDFHMGPIALDLKLLSFGWRLESLSEKMDPVERRKIQQQIVLDVYRESRTFSEKWESLMPLLGICRDIQFDAWFSARWKDPGFAEYYSGENIANVGWWTDNIDKLEQGFLL